MPGRQPIVLIHGYHDNASGMQTWVEKLANQGYETTEINVAQYVTLNNEVTIQDIAEGFDRALRLRSGLDKDQPFDVIVHSTGVLVIRDWLTSRDDRWRRVKRIIALAPATFGSPLAHRGRSLLGAIFEGDHVFGPDFMAAGDRVLSALELGSRYTWELAHRDLVNGRKGYYDAGPETPYPFVFVGTSGYGGVRSVVNKPGTDGAVRWAGVGFNVRKITINLVQNPEEPIERRIDVAPWKNARVPLVLLRNLNHGTILNEPPTELVTMVFEALEVTDQSAYEGWFEKHAWKPPEADDPRGGGHGDGEPPVLWQQFVVRALDQRGDPISDYFVEISAENEKGVSEKFDLDVATFADDPSLRCFHVNLSDLKPETKRGLKLRIIASSGTDRIGYYGEGSEKFDDEGLPRDAPGLWDGALGLDFEPTCDVKFFFPYTTTLIEIRLNREPLPLDFSQASGIAKFV